MWQDISTASKSPAVGGRSKVIIGIDSKGSVHTTYCMPNHPKGDDWLIFDGEYIVSWEPVLWCDIPKEIDLHYNGFKVPIG